MPNYPEIRNIAREVRRRIKQDPNNPYRVRRRKAGIKDSRGGTGSANEFDFRTMTNILTQPLGRIVFNRLNEGLKNRKPRFVGVVPLGKLFQTQDEIINNGEQIEYFGEWYEVKETNNWDLVMHGIMVTVE